MSAPFLDLFHLRCSNPIQCLHCEYRDILNGTLSFRSCSQFLWIYLTLRRRYQPRDSKSDDSSSSDEELVIPAGRPYLTKVNGKLVMAREKKDKPIDIAVGLLGEAYGGGTRVIQRRARSVDKEKFPGQIGGVPFTQQLQPIYTTPLFQQGLAQSTGLIPLRQYQQYPYQPQLMQQLHFPRHPVPQPTSFTIPDPNFNPKPTKEDFEQLKVIDAHYNEISKRGETNSQGSEAAEEIALRTHKTLIRHICENCGRLRSRKYHHDNPIKAGEALIPASCKKCQRDASSTSSSDAYHRHRATHKTRIWPEKEKGSKPRVSLIMSQIQRAYVDPGIARTRKS